MKFHFEQLDVWKIGMELVAEVYRLSANFPSTERFGLTSQLQRSAVSIPANIAEGKGRFSKREYRNYLYIARGSLYETITHLRIAQRLGYIKEIDLQNVDEIIRAVLSKLSGLTRSLESEDRSTEPRAQSPM